MGRIRLSLANCRLAREFLAEFLGMFLLVTFGDGSVAQALLGGASAGGAITIAWSFGVGITPGVMVSGAVSGGHINPAVSTAMVCLRKLPLKKLPVYALAQYLGGFAASVFIWLIYWGSELCDRREESERGRGVLDPITLQVNPDRVYADVLRNGPLLDPITLQVNPDRVYADVLRNGPLHEKRPFRLIQRQFQTADENWNGALEKTEVKKFLDKLLVLKFCMERTA